MVVVIPGLTEVSRAFEPVHICLLSLTDWRWMVAATVTATVAFLSPTDSLSVACWLPCLL